MGAVGMYSEHYQCLVAGWEELVRQEVGACWHAEGDKGSGRGSWGALRQ